MPLVRRPRFRSACLVATFRSAAHRRFTRRRVPRYFSPDRRAANTCGLRLVQRVNRSMCAAFVGPDLLQISGRQRFCGAHTFRSPKHHIASRSSCSASTFKSSEVLPVTILIDAAGQIAGFKYLVQIAAISGYFSDGMSDYRISSGNQRQHQREKSEQRRIVRADDSDGADGFVHGDGNIAERRIVNSAIEFVGPRSVGKQSFDARLHFRRCLLCSDRRRQPAL